MEFKITDGFAIGLSNDKKSLLVIPPQTDSGDDCESTTTFRSFDMSAGITMKLVTKETMNSGNGDALSSSDVEDFLIIETGKIPATPPASKFQYTIDMSAGWPDIRLKSYTRYTDNDEETNSSVKVNKLAAMLINNALATPLSCLPTNKFLVSNVQTDIVTLDLNTINYTQITSDGSTLTIDTVY